MRSNARRHYRTHGESPPQRGSPAQFQAGFKFAELIGAPEQPLPPPVSLSQAPFRVRWVPPNTTALTKVTHPVKRHEKKWNSPENADDSHEQQMQDPMFLYDPFSAAEPSTDDIRDIHSSSRTYPSGKCHRTTDFHSKYLCDNRMNPLQDYSKFTILDIYYRNLYSRFFSLVASRAYTSLLTLHCHRIVYVAAIFTTCMHRCCRFP